MIHQKTNEYAPIFVSVHTRLHHFKKCIESLLSNPEAKFSDIYISSDSYRNDKEKTQVEAIRNYIKLIKGFKSVNPIFFEKNVGIEFAGKFCFDKIFNKSNSIIVLEDDIEVSPLFLKYINTGLCFYENDPKVFSICGFSPIILGENNFSENFLFKSNDWNAWGFGTWKSKFNAFTNFRNSNKLFSDIKLNIGSRTFRKKLDNLSLEHYPHLLYSEKQKITPEFDYLAGYYCLKNNFFNIYIAKSFTINNGNDGSGLRAKNNNEISSKMKSEALSNEIIEFKKLNDLRSIEKLPHYSKSSLVIFIKILLIKFRLFKVGKNVYNIFYEFKTNLYEKIIR